MLQINESSNGQEITLPVNQALEICLQENPTTGFRWSLESKGEPVCVFVRDFFESPSDAPGRGGMSDWGR
jgi:predicted secreted protein